MAQKFEQLFSIDIAHNYYEDGRSRDFILTPTRDCLQNLDNHNLLFRPFDGGGSIFFTRLLPADEILRKIVTVTRFRFLLSIKEPGFSNYTILPTDGGSLEHVKISQRGNLRISYKRNWSRNLW